MNIDLNKVKTDKTQDSYSHLYAIKSFMFHAVVSADNMDEETARYIVCQNHPIIGRIFPVRYFRIS